jgi:hypothetical protein
MIIFLAVLVCYIYWVRNEVGCTGDCNQGRRPCNCKRGRDE